MTIVTSRIRCDPANFGEVFGCLGLMEIEGARSGERSGQASTGHFVDDADGPCFVMESACGVTLHQLVEELLGAELRALRPVGLDLSDKKIDTVDAPFPDRTFPALPPEKGGALPIRLCTPHWRMVFSSWAENPIHTGRDNAKFWAGKYSGASVAELVLASVRVLDGYERDAAVTEPWSFTAPMPSSYRMDYSRDYIPLSSGFSPNDQANVLMVGHPLVELLAALGLEHARPQRILPRDKLLYRYGVPKWPASLPLMRAALSGGDTGLPARAFVMSLGWPGKENLARCIVHIVEETPS